MNKAVEQLRRNGVPVPEDLLSLKLSLSTRDASDSENHEIKNRLKEVEALIEQLRKILKAARSIKVSIAICKVDQINIVNWLC